MSPWVQTLHGRSFDLANPRAADVDFHEIAQQLATINRYAGAAMSVVSVATHTLIAAENAPPSIRPWVLAHDAHETALGDWPTPAKHALVLSARMLGGSAAAMMVKHAIDHTFARVDAAIWEAAGLDEPTDEQRRQIKFYDLLAMQTERRDFLAPAPARWAPEIEAAPAARKVYRPGHFGKTPFDVGERLWREFQTWFPALKGARQEAAE